MHCVFYPQIGGHHEQGFIEAAGLLTGLHDTPYVSVVALKEIAQKFPDVGLCNRDDLTLAQAEAEALKRENEDLKAQLAEADKFAEAAEWTLKHFNTRVQAKPGRKPTTQKAA